MVLGSFNCWLRCVDVVIVACNHVACGDLFLQEVLDALAAFVVQNVEFWLVPEAFQFVVNFFKCTDHAFVLAGFHRQHKNSVEFIHVRNENVVLSVV